LNQIYDIQEIAFDDWGAEQLRQKLEDDGIEMSRFGQNFKSMSPACEDMMRTVLEGRLAHGGNPVLRWNFDNVVVRMDESGNIRPDKKRAVERIDGAVAALMSLRRAILQEKKKKTGGSVVIDWANNTITRDGVTKPIPTN